LGEAIHRRVEEARAKIVRGELKVPDK
jgi:hypothetical protein